MQVPLPGSPDLPPHGGITSLADSPSPLGSKGSPEGNTRLQVDWRTGHSKSTCEAFKELHDKGRACA